jgi:hypothetical protein
MSTSTSRPGPKELLPIAGGVTLAAAGIAGLLGLSRAVSWLALAVGLALIAGGTAWRAAVARKGPPLAAAYPAPRGWPEPPRRHPAARHAAGRWPAPPAGDAAGLGGGSAFAAALDAWQRASPATRGAAPVRADDDHHPI